MQSIKYNILPRKWDSSAGYPNKKPLSFWADNLLKRHNQMDNWVSGLKHQNVLMLLY